MVQSAAGRFPFRSTRSSRPTGSGGTPVRAHPASRARYPRTTLDAFGGNGLGGRAGRRTSSHHRRRGAQRHPRREPAFLVGQAKLGDRGLAPPLLSRLDGFRSGRRRSSTAGLGRAAALLAQRILPHLYVSGGGHAQRPDDDSRQQLPDPLSAPYVDQFEGLPGGGDRGPRKGSPDRARSPSREGFRRRGRRCSWRQALSSEPGRSRAKDWPSACCC